MAFSLDLDPGLTVLGTAKNAIEGLKGLRKRNPDMVVLDLSMPHLSGMDAILPLRAARPEVTVSPTFSRLDLSRHTESRL